MKEYILAIPNHKDGEADPAYVQGTVVGELTRCKDCTYWMAESCVLHECKCEDDEFCSWAVERK